VLEQAKTVRALDRAATAIGKRQQLKKKSAQQLKKKSAARVLASAHTQTT
jgi:hypothetical protein